MVSEKSKVNSVFSNYVKKLSDNEVALMYTRLSERMSDDLASVINRFSTNSSVNEILSSAANADEFYYLIDVLSEHIFRETERRKLNIDALVYAS